MARNPLVELRRLVAPAARQRSATVAAILGGGLVELAVAADTSTPSMVIVPDVPFAWADAPEAWGDAPGAWLGEAGTVVAGTTAARPVVSCGVAVAVGDRVLVEGGRVVRKLVRETTRTVVIL